MEGDPRDHDFDQRLDGPHQEPTRPSESHPFPPTDPDTLENKKGRAQTVDFGALGQPGSDTSAPHRTTSNPNVASPPRHSIQAIRTRASRDMGRRSSRDFDRRVDGPFGRPSLTMTRRRSDGHQLPPTPTFVSSPVALTSEESKELNTVATGDQPPPASIETLQSSTDPAFEPEPPSLNYTLRTRYRSIAFFWSLVVIDSTAMPLGLYYGLHYGTSLSPNTVFSIVTAAIGGISIVEYCVRFWRLWKHSSTCRVIGARRAYLDWFHWNLSVGWFIVMIELIVGTVFTHPPIRLLSMPLTSMLYAFGIELLIVDVLRYFHVPAPVRLSSIPKGAQLRPCVYSFIEDVCAVDGSGGTEFREALNRRYEASHIFRAMLRRLGLFWAVGSNATAVLCTILIFTLDNHDAVYAIGWSVPFIWAGIWVLITIWYVKKKLREESKAWTEEVNATKAAV
ncbi:hypothetical protein BDY17DRAFT_302392 [Neohortaea acidophila]|uniref:Uncharacterized protein n=1 Tax=Neohortaea acidophila TaxID=245834 RepID=A0A6A6PNF0_9PEZI|nr:uncharacterized protein BDY17DRAFT_302392 [Neohortaea acidophila]KAF2480787.1 hypothetical protein BDY17DRAFT_302392 [Neohortaea acidophila]